MRLENTITCMRGGAIEPYIYKNYLSPKGHVLFTCPESVRYRRHQINYASTVQAQPARTDSQFFSPDR